MAWNIYRYIGDGLHIFSKAFLLSTIAYNRSVSGLSKRTQILYSLVFVSRYLDVFVFEQIAYLLYVKLGYICSSFFALALFTVMKASYQVQSDTCNIFVIVIPCAIAAILFGNDSTVMELAWTFSQFLEGFAMVPQYVFCYREAGNSELGTTVYVIAMGCYRVCYILNWLDRMTKEAYYVDWISWTGGAINLAFFLDFLLSRFADVSLLRANVLRADNKINTISEKVEAQVLGTSPPEVTSAQAEYDETWAFT
mmetsp:Transcript_3579/g.7857  ORF Transcript_3579/g.7857 Transcript_3579/m.7857 type:complete len:253 (+) Transcript_3579:111-869(+)